MATINNLYIDQGTTFSVNIQVFDTAGNPLNIIGYTANSQIRKSYASSNTAATFSANISNPANGIVNLSLTAQQTEALKYGRYVYDLNIKSGGVTLRASEGIVTVYPQVTK
jgi:hypothetical protein